MPVTKITAVGGVMPSVSPRSLPDIAGQKSHNLMPSVSEFRPLGGDVVVAPTTYYTKTIYRLARTSTGAFNTNPATGWVTSSDERSYVKGQLNDDTTERTYFTFNDSDQPPRVIDAQGSDRRLGVPAPIFAPTVTVNVVDEYTAEDRDADLSVAALEAAKIIKAHMMPMWVGPDVVGHLTTYQVAYFGRAAPEFVPEDEAQMVRIYGRGTGDNGSAIVASYSPADASKFSWVYTMGLGGFEHSRVAGNAIISGSISEQHFWCLPFYGRAVTYKLDRAAFVTAIQELEVAGTKQFDAEAAEKLADAIDDATIGNSVKTLFQDHKAKATGVLALMDGGQDAVYVSLVKAFYEREPVVTLIATAVENLANQVYQFATTLATATDWSPRNDGEGQ